MYVWFTVELEVLTWEGTVRRNWSAEVMGPRTSSEARCAVSILVDLFGDTMRALLAKQVLTQAE